MIKQCVDCKYYHHHDGIEENQGECRCNPPVMLAVMTVHPLTQQPASVMHTSFVTVAGDWFCGLWQKKGNQSGLIVGK